MLETSSREFVEWSIFLDQEERRKWDTATPEHYYLAQIAKEVRSVLAKKPSEILVKHFLMKFVTDNQKKDQDIIDVVKKKAELSKQYWMGLFFGEKTSVDSKVPVSDKKDMR